MDSAKIIKELSDLVAEAFKTGEHFYKLTGEHDPLLRGVRVQTADGKWRDMGDVRLSDIGHWQVLDYDAP